MTWTLRIGPLIVASVITVSHAVAQEGAFSLYGDGPARSTCERAARRAAQREGVPLDILVAVGLTETGRTLANGQAVIWPWSIATSDGGSFFPTRRDARQAVEAFLKSGRRSVDIGCMQVNYRWHGEGFASVDDMLDPYKNTAYAAAHLRDLFERFGDWTSATARYHSFDDARGDAYAEKVTTNRVFAEDFLAASAPGGVTLDLFANGERKTLYDGAAVNRAARPILPKFAVERPS